MLLKNCTLAKKRDFNLLLKHGYFINNTFFSVKVLKLDKISNYFPKNEDATNFKKQLRIAISIGLKISKSAVKRNKLKRQVKEVLRLSLKDDQLKTGYYLLFIAKPGSLTKTYAEISTEIELLLKKSKVLQ